MGFIGKLLETAALHSAAGALSKLTERALEKGYEVYKDRQERKEAKQLAASEAIKQIREKK